MGKQDKKTKASNIRANLATVFAMIALGIAILFCIYLTVSWVSPCHETGCGDFVFVLMPMILFSAMLLLASKLVEPTMGIDIVNKSITTKMKIAKYCRIIIILITTVSILLFLNSYR